MRLIQIFTSELKYQLRSVVFWIFTGVVVMFFVTQFGWYRGNEDLKPGSGANTQMFTNNLTPDQGMREIETHLRLDLSSKTTLSSAGPINKKVKVQPEAQRAMEELLEDVQSQRISYDEFTLKVNKIDQLLGGNTIYGDKHRKEYLIRPQTQEEASKEFDTMVNHEGLTNAYGKMLADYMGITAGFFPTFIAAFLLGRDKRTIMAELVRVRTCGSLTYIFAKYLAVVALLGLVYLLISVQPTYAFYKIVTANGWTFHPFGFVKFTLGWVLPTLMFTTALSMFFSEITGSGIAAIPLQLILWFTSLSPLKGDYSLSKYVIRFNSAGSYDLLEHSLNAIALNRVFYIGLSLALVGLCAWVWEKNRARGGIGHGTLGKLFRAGKVQLPVN